MLFNSFEFGALLGIAFALYYLPVTGRWRKNWQVNVLLIGSAVFYGWEDVRLLGLLALSCVGNSLAVRAVILHQLAGRDLEVKRWVRGSIFANLALLAVFKYAGFLAGCLPFLPAGVAEAWRSIPLPIGISFYTFHGISMILDVARGEVRRESQQLVRPGETVAGLRDTGLYLLFFPQLVAGPIVKAKQFWPQIVAKELGEIEWMKAIRYLITGYFLKLVVADNLAEQTALLTAGPKEILHHSAGQMLPLLYGYACQIFADFAGYSLIAIGLATLFGYRLPENFRYPYLAVSVSEFWRRWHMSLSSWLRDYLYIPLGGNRKGPGRTYVNLFLVMFLGGLWHGAEWKFAIWGTLHGLLIAAERFFGLRLPAATKPSRLRALAGWFFTFHAVTFLWLTFLMPDLPSIAAFFQALARWDGMSGSGVYAVAVFGGCVVAYHGWGWLKEHRPRLAAAWSSPWLEGLCHASMIFLMVTNFGAPRGFIYFQF